MRRKNGFTIIEMMVVLLLIAILAGIVMAVGSQVQQNSERSLTQTELRNLQAALQQYIHKTGQTPANMLSFLEGYQAMHAYAVSASPYWQQHPNVITDLPNSMVVAGELPPPTGSQSTSDYLPGVVEILDAYGYPIQYMPPSPPPAISSDQTYPYSGQTTPTLPTTLAAGAAWVYVTTGSSTILPAQDSHAPYFYSYGANGPQSTGTDPTSGYIYSYAP
ncbi:MAG: type II secretion system protein [Phycisphaerae bacterium]|nr:type II secretion system protein [Phycisphaerae bacterium]